MNEKPKTIYEIEKIVKEHEAKQAELITVYNAANGQNAEEEVTQPEDTELDKVLDAVMYIQDKIGKKPLAIIAAFSVLPGVSISGGIGMAAAAINPVVGGIAFLSSMATLWAGPLIGSMKLLEKAEERRQLLEKYELIKSAEKQQSKEHYL